MIAKESDWYKTIWSLDIKNQSWVEDTRHQTDFIIKALDLRKNQRILDLACGFGRHSLELARRGFEVVGADITRDYITDAENTAKAEGLSARFILSDIRDLKFDQEFDVVLNLADGAIGYLENDEENLKIFDVIASALKPGGKTSSYGDHLVKPEITSGDPIRLYSHKELDGIFKERDMIIKETYSNYYGKPETSKELQLMVYSVKQ